MNESTIFYRYDQIDYEYETALRESTFSLIKETRCGWWILQTHVLGEYAAICTKRWVSKTACKRFAYPTKKEALVNFIARKRRQISMLNYQLDRAGQAWELAETKLKEFQ
jgi:hypothetical protein